MLQPRKSKYNKCQKGRIGRILSQDFAFGKYGLQSLRSGRLQANVIEARRRVITRTCKRNGQMWIRVFPDIPVSRKPAEVRMGKGKGARSWWMCRIRKGQLLFELDGVSESLAREAVRLASHKLPFPTQFLIRQKR